MVEFVYILVCFGGIESFKQYLYFIERVTVYEFDGGFIRVDFFLYVFVIKTGLYFDRVGEVLYNVVDVDSQYRLFFVS